MYNLYGYGSMIADRVRMDAYVEALRRSIRPTSVVLDLGTGAGIFALLACRFGARKVYAIELASAIQVAREIASANGYGERIDFMQNLSTRETLPERVDVIISDLRGVLPLFEDHLPSVADARERFLAPGGILIPQRDTLWVAVVEAPSLYNSFVDPWKGNGYGLDMQKALRMVTNTWRKGRVAPEQFLVEPLSWAAVDYTAVATPDVSGAVTFTATRSGTGHGLIVWFDAMLAEGVCFSNSPSAPELIYGSAFFPWWQPVSIAAGDTVAVGLQANLVGKDYTWSWNTCVLEQGRSGNIKARFKQSTFFGMPFSSPRLRRKSSDYVPTLNEDGNIEQLILASMTGEVPLSEIAQRVLERFPTRFARWQDALTLVSEVSDKYS